MMFCSRGGVLDRTVWQLCSNSREARVIIEPTRIVSRTPRRLKDSSCPAQVPSYAKAIMKPPLLDLFLGLAPRQAVSVEIVLAVG